MCDKTNWNLKIVNRSLGVCQPENIMKQPEKDKVDVDSLRENRLELRKKY